MLKTSRSDKKLMMNQIWTEIDCNDKIDKRKKDGKAKGKKKRFYKSGKKSRYQIRVKVDRVKLEAANSFAARSFIN